MHRKVSFKEGSRSRFPEDRSHAADRGSFRLSEQKLASVRELIKQQQQQTQQHLVYDSHFSGDSSDSTYKLMTDGFTASDFTNSNPLVQSNVTLRKIHHAADPVFPMTSSGGNVILPDGETLSPVRTRKVARKMAGSDEEENLPATPLLPGKIRVESLKTKPKKDVKPGDKNKTAKVDGAPITLQKASTMPVVKDVKKTGLMALAMSAPVPGDNEGARAKKGPSEKRVRSEEAVRAYKRGLEVAWQVIGPPPASSQSKRTKSPDSYENKGKRRPDQPAKKSQPAASKSAPVPQPSKEEPAAAVEKAEEDLDKSIEITEEGSKDPFSIDESHLPPVGRSLMQDLRADLATRDDEPASKSKPDSKPKSALIIKAGKPSEDKNKKEGPCPKKSRPVTDREAIQSYIKQQRLARSSAEQQRRAELTRLEREKQARLQALYEHQQAVAKIPVRELLPESYHAPPRISLRLPSSVRREDEETVSESTGASPAAIPSPGAAETKPPAKQPEKVQFVEPKSTVATVANALVPDAGRTERVCAILQSALSLQVKLRAEVDRVERYISMRSGSAAPAEVPGALHPKTPASVAKYDAAIQQNGQHFRASPTFLHELSGFSEPQLSAPQPTLRDSSTSPVFTSPEKGTSPTMSYLDRTLTPQSPTKQVRLMTPEMPHDSSKDHSSVTSHSVSPLSTAPVQLDASVQSSVLGASVLPINRDPWNVASVLRRSFGIGTTPGREMSRPQRQYADAELQTTFMGSPPHKFTSDVGVQSANETFEDSTRPDLVEACIQTIASPNKSVVEDVMSDESSFFSQKPIISPIPPKPSQRVAEILREEAETERVAPEVLDAQLHAELDLLASLDGYHRQLDDLERMRTNAEQNTDVAGLVTLMNTVENHVRETLQQAHPVSPLPRPRSSTKKAEKEPPKSEPPPPLPVVQQIVQQPVQIPQEQMASLTAFELRQDIERRFQALEAATGRRMAEDSERLLEAHLRTSIAVSDLTRQLADMQRQSLLSLEERERKFKSAEPPPPPPSQPEPQVRYHRRQTFSPPRPPPLAPPVVTVEETTTPRMVTTASTLTVPSEVLAKSISTATKSVEEESVSEEQPSSMTVTTEDEIEEKSPVESEPESPKPTDQSLVRRGEDHKMLCELIAQQARQSSLRFRADIAELTLREREAKKRANNELTLIENRRKTLLAEKKPESKVEIDRLTKLKGKILAAYAKEKKHLESLKRSSTRLASEQKSLADQLRRSLPADLSGFEDSLALSESAIADSRKAEKEDHDLSLQLQMQIEQLAGDEDKLSRSVVDQLLTGREHMLEERLAIAEQLLARKAQLDAKEEDIRKLEERLAHELATPKRPPPQQGSSSRPKEQLLVVPSAPQKTPRPISAAGRTDDDVASLPESIAHSDRNVATTPGSTTAPPIPSSSIAGLGEILELEKRQKDESVTEIVASTAKSTTPAATVVSEEGVTEEVETEQPGDDYEDDDFEPEKSKSASSVKSERTVSGPPAPPPVDTKRVETLRDELAEKRQMVRELKIARDEIKRKREMERVRAKETKLSTKLAQKDDEICQLEEEIAALQAASIRSESKQSLSEIVESIPSEAEEEEKKPEPEPKPEEKEKSEVYEETFVSETEKRKSLNESVKSELQQKFEAPSAMKTASDVSEDLEKSISEELEEKSVRSDSKMSRKSDHEARPESAKSDSRMSLKSDREARPESAKSESKMPQKSDHEARPESVKSDSRMSLKSDHEARPESAKSESKMSRKSSERDSMPESVKSESKGDVVKTASDVLVDALEVRSDSKMSKKSDHEPVPVLPEPVKIVPKLSASDMTEASESIKFDSEQVVTTKIVHDEEYEDDFFTSEVKIPPLEPAPAPKKEEIEEQEPPRPISRLSDRSKQQEVETETEISESIHKSVSEPIQDEPDKDVIDLEKSLEIEPEIEVKQNEEEKIEKKEEAEPEIEKEPEDEQYSESFSAESSSRHPTVSSAKDFEGAEEVNEEVGEAEEEEEDLDDFSASGDAFLDLGATLAMPDSNSTPVSAAPPQLDATYTVSSTASMTPTQVPEAVTPPGSPDATPKPGRRSREEIAETVADEVFPDLVKEAVDSAVLTYQMSPKKQNSPPSPTSPVRVPLPPDFEVEDGGDSKDDFYDDDDKAFDNVAEVASRLRSMAGVASGGSSVPKLAPEPALVPFLVTRRQQLPKLVREYVEFLWRERAEGHQVEETTRPAEITLERTALNQSDDVTASEAQFCDLVFDTAKFLFDDVFARCGGKIVPTSIDEVYRTVFAQIAPFVGLSAPGASSTGGIPHRVQFATVGRRRDAVDEVLLAELYAEPSDAWCDFTQDEEAVREEVVTSLVSSLVEDLMSSLEPFFPRITKKL